ncbi:MAG: EamA family transporter [Cytophagaceae bacterium]
MENLVSGERFLSRIKLSERTIIIMAFFAVYVIWGSTYLGIKYAIETFPPFIMSGVRVLIAGLILHAVAQYSNAPKANWKNWKNSTIVGFLLIVIGNGGLVWAEQKVPSGIAALLITIEPLWVVLLQMVFRERKGFHYVLWIAMVLAFSGMLMLMGPSVFNGISSVDPMGFFVIMISTLGWAAGSLYAVKADLPTSPARSTSMQMISASVILLVISVFTGEWNSFDLANISDRSYFAFGYLVIFGSVVGYSAYSYLTRSVSPSKVSTYAYVNPVIAVLLGTLIGGEPFNASVLISGVMIISAVVLIMTKGNS